MKKTIGIAFFLFAAAAMAQDVIRGSYSYTYGDRESLVEARQVCKDLALREAIESYRLVVESSTKIENFQLKEDIIESIAVGYLQEIKVVSQTEEGRTVSTTIEAKLIPADIRQLIDQKLSSSHSNASEDTSKTVSDIPVSGSDLRQQGTEYINDFETTSNRSRGFANRSDYKSALESMAKLKIRLESRKPSPDQEFQWKLYQAIQAEIAVFTELCHVYQFKTQKKPVRARINTNILREKNQELVASSRQLRDIKNLTESMEAVRERCLKQCDLTIHGVYRFINQ